MRRTFLGDPNPGIHQRDVMNAYLQTPAEPLRTCFGCNNLRVLRDHQTICRTCTPRYLSSFQTGDFDFALARTIGVNGCDLDEVRRTGDPFARCPECVLREGLGPGGVLMTVGDVDDAG